MANKKKNSKKTPIKKKELEKIVNKHNNKPNIVVKNQPIKNSTSETVVKKDGPKTTKPVVKKDGSKTTKPVVKKDGSKTTKPVVKKDSPKATKPVVKKDSPKTTKPVVKKDSPKTTKPVVKNTNLSKINNRYLKNILEFLKLLLENKLATIFIIIWCIVGISFIAIPDEDFSENENRYLEKFPEFNINEFFSGDYVTKLSSYITDNFVLRKFFLELKSDVQLLFGQSEINNVYIGDEYLFEKYETPLNTDDLISTLNNFAPEKNVNLMLIPSSGLINTDKLPKNVSFEKQNDIMNYIYSNVSMKNIDVRELFYKANKSYPIYYKLDHHYTAYGAYFSYVEYCKHNNLEPIALDITNVSRFFYGTLYSKTNLYDSDADILSAYITDTVSKVTYVDSGVEKTSIYDYEKLRTKDKYSFFLGGNHPLITIENNVAGDELLVIKDSFANSLIPYLTKHYSKIHVIDLRYYNLSVDEYITQNNINNILIVYGLQGLDTDTGIYKLN